MITNFSTYINEAVTVKIGDVFSFNEVLLQCANDRKRAIPQFKKMLLGRRLNIVQKDFRGRVKNTNIVPMRVVVWPNRDYFKLFSTKNPQDQNFTSISFNDKIEVMSSIKQIFDPYLDPYGEELWEVDENTKYKAGDPRGELDPYGEEIWDDRELARQPGRWDREIELYHQQMARGDELLAEWRANNNRYGQNKFIGKILGDKHVCSFGEEFDDTDHEVFGFDGPLEDYNNPLDAGVLPLSDFYNDDTQIYTCPKCNKKSKVEREHGGGWICRKCGLNSRNWGNGLYVWE